MKSRQTRPKRRRRPAARRPFYERYRRYILAPIYLGAAAAVCAGSYLLAKDFVRFTRETDFFKISDVRVAGASTLLEAQVHDAVTDLTAEGRHNLLFFDLNRARFKIEHIPRVRSVRLEKKFPQTLKVHIEERQPLLAANCEGLFWMDREGVLLGRASAEEVVREQKPILTGLNAPKPFAGMQVEQPHLIDVLDAHEFLSRHDPQMAGSFAEWNISAQDEVTGILHEGVEVRFGEAPVKTKLAVLGSVLREKTDLDQYTYFDLRFDSQVVYF